MKIRDSFKDIKNTLKMELGKIKIEALSISINKTKIDDLKFKSNVAIKELKYNINAHVQSYKTKSPIIKNINPPKTNISSQSMNLKDFKFNMGEIALPTKTIKVNFENFETKCTTREYEDFLSLKSLQDETMNLNSKINNEEIRSIKNKNIFSIKRINKRIRIKRFKKPQLLPMIKKPVNRKSVNFVYVFKGKEYLERFGYEHSDLIFINYYTSVPMDLVTKMIVNEDELRIHYKRGIPKNIIDIATFKSKREKKLLIAPILKQ